VQMNTAIFERPSGRSLAKIMNSSPALPRGGPTRAEPDQPLGGVIPDLPKRPEPAPGFERLVGEPKRPTAGGPQLTRSLEGNTGGGERQHMAAVPQVASVDEWGILRITVLELRSRLDASEGQSQK